MGSDKQTRKDAGNVLEGLHKGLGVRRTNLYRHLGPALRGILGITSADATSARERTTQWLEQSLAELTDCRRLVQIARVTYNLESDPRLNGLNYGDRVEVLAARFARRGFSKRSIERRRDEIVQHLHGCLDQLISPPAAAESAVVRQPEPDCGSVRDALRAVHDPRSRADLAIDVFLAHNVHVPCAPTGGLVAIKAAGPSIWVCAFTHPDRLEDYRLDSSARWATGSHRVLGADLVRTATRTGDPVGILLNPHAGERVALSEMLSIPPDLTARIGKSLRSGQTPVTGPDESTDRFPLPSGTWSS